MTTAPSRGLPSRSSPHSRIGRGFGCIGQPGPSRTRVEILPPDETSDYVPIDYVDAEGTVERAVPAVESWRRSAAMTVEEFGGEPEQVFRELVLAQAATRHDNDLLVAGATALDAPMWRRFRAEANVAEPRTACALLGLYLRAHGDFTVRVGQVTNFLDQERYYRGAAVAALPAHDAWLHAAFTVSRQQQAAEPLRLVRGVGMRLARALRARDYFNVRVRAIRPDDTWGEALFFFEALLLLLGGALDSAARFAHVVYGLPGSIRAASWRREDWASALSASEPAFEPLVGATGTVRATADLVGILRNYIHGEALSQELQLTDDRGPLVMDYQPGALAVEPDDGWRLLAAADILGSREEWGLEVGHKDVVLVLPGQYLAPVVRAVVAALQAVMEAVDLDRLTPDRAEPVDPAFLTPGYEYQSELLLLTGLDDGR